MISEAAAALDSIQQARQRRSNCSVAGTHQARQRLPASDCGTSMLQTLQVCHWSWFATAAAAVCVQQAQLALTLM
jgi:hypothetical protein